MKILSKVIIVLVFVLAGVLFFHNLTSINADMGRHIKIGEIIWQTGEVPKTNLFSYTAPDFPFVNHHWLSEVIFYGAYSLGSDSAESSSDDSGASWISGLRTVMIFKIIVLLAAYFLLFLTVKRFNIFSVVLAFLVSIFVFSARTEPRPEIFSYLIFAAYLFIIYKVRENRVSNFYRDSRLRTGTFSEKFRISNQLFNNLIFKLRNYKIYSKLEIKNLKFNWLWLLPLLQLLWVNLHIYFIVGPIIYLFFLIDRFVNSKFKHSNFIRNSRFEILVFFFVLFANLANPNFIDGALYPLKVLNNYGYSVAENSSLFFLAKYFGHWALQDKLFLISLFVLGGSFVVSFWRNKFGWNWLQTRIFDLLLVIMTAALSFKMQRNIPLYALSLWPIMAKNMDDFLNFEFCRPASLGEPRLFRAGISNFEKLKKWFYACALFILITGIYLVVSNRFYNWLNSPKVFGLGVSSAAQNGTDFIKANKVQGPVFNNFDIGSYLVWQLYPDQKVFVDGRPEAYPAEFFEKIYKPMQRDENVWREMSEKYGIHYIFFAHTDMTEWAGEFLTRINKNDKWPMVFLNNAVVVFLKDNDTNQPIIAKYKITDQNIEDKIPLVLAKLDKKDDNAFINLGNALFRFRWLDASAKVFEALIANQPDNPYGYQGAAYAYVTMNDPATQEKAAQNLEKAIGLGFKTFNNYFILGIINVNLGNLFSAEENIKKALKISPNNKNAQQVLETIRMKLDLQ